GYPTQGVEACEGMLQESRRLYSQWAFHQDFLPDLETLADQSFDNLLCCAVLMHLPEKEIPLAIKNLLRILRPRGRGLVSWRWGIGGQEREDGKLYTPLTVDTVQKLFIQNGGNVLQEYVQRDTENPQKVWHTLVFQKN
ncbi:MAG: class I SAM-dependent methyltransferase, partial [Pseudomonadota bacterium]